MSVREPIGGTAGPVAEDERAGWEVSEPVLLFDGDCGLCAGWVRVLLGTRRAAALRFAPLQGRYGQEQLKRLGLPTEDFDSLVFLPRGARGPALRRTDGALAVLGELGGFWGLWARVGGWVPVAIRDGLYRCVARMRYLIFGRAGAFDWAAAARAGRVLP
jgi:predicted DCC family thiol-disulfide oxidoreductase YuxK